MSFRHNEMMSRFEWVADQFSEGHTAFADYRLSGHVLHLLHVEAPPALRGTGAAGKLMDEIMRHARRKNLKVEPECSYAEAWIRKHAEYHDLLA